MTWAPIPLDAAQSLAAPAISANNKLFTSQKDVGGACNAVKCALPGSVAVVEEIFCLGIVDGDDGIGELSCLFHAA
jgi:hypothetical protein